MSKIQKTKDIGLLIKAKRNQKKGTFSSGRVYTITPNKEVSMQPAIRKKVAQGTILLCLLGTSAVTSCLSYSYTGIAQAEKMPDQGIIGMDREKRSSISMECRRGLFR